MKTLLRALVLPLLLLCAGSTLAQTDDPYLWLEEVTGDKALAWAREQNTRTEKQLTADPRYEPLRADLLAILDSQAQIPYVTRHGAHYYNFWRDAEHPRGLWRRTPVAAYAKAEPPWETVLDLDALGRVENENWVWQAPTCLRPAGRDAPLRRCLLRLSRGGADAAVVREFDVEARTFVADGFALKEAKVGVEWQDADHVWVGTDFGADSLTDSGYPRVVKRWRRGTSLAAATTVFTGMTGDVGIWPMHDDSGPLRDWIVRAVGVREQEYFVIRDDKPVKLDLPRDVQLTLYKGWLVLRTRSDWSVGGTTYRAGSLLAIDGERFLRGARDLQVLYAPADRRALQSVATTRTGLLLTELDNVRSRLRALAFDGKRWRSRALPTPENAQLTVVTTDWDADEYLITVQGITQPTTLYAGRGDVARWDDFRPLKSLPALFDATGIVTEQHEATSRDGTRVPYFIARRKDAPLDGNAPTVMQGYGGFAIPNAPTYSAAFGRGWLQAGGFLVRANIRGGGEFGPAWHRAAQREGRQKTFDDFIAVGEDLVRRGFTRPAKLGILGGSQGGLLVTGSLVQRPDLFGAVVAQVPLADMLRFHKLLAGASWIGEYGNPDVEADRAFIAKYSPYQNTRAGTPYPPLLVLTSTRDDRVHPGHARKLAAKMQEQGHDVLYFENVEGGHAGSADHAQAARMWAMTFTFLARALGLPAR